MSIRLTDMNCTCYYSTLHCDSGGNRAVIDSHPHSTMDNTDTLGGHSTAARPLPCEPVSTARDRDEPKTVYQPLSRATLLRDGPYQTCSNWGTSSNKGDGIKSEKKQYHSKLPLPCEPVSIARNRDQPKTLYQPLSGATLQRYSPYQTRSDWQMAQSKGGDKYDNKKQCHSKLAQASRRNVKPPDMDCGVEDVSGVMEKGIYESCT